MENCEDPEQLRAMKQWEVENPRTARSNEAEGGGKPQNSQKNLMKHSVRFPCNIIVVTSPPCQRPIRSSSAINAFLKHIPFPPSTSAIDEPLTPESSCACFTAKFYVHRVLITHVNPILFHFILHFILK